MKNIFLVVFLLITPLSTKAQNEHYYYYHGEKIYLDLYLNRISINSFTQDTNFFSKILSDNFTVSEVIPRYSADGLYYFEIEFDNSISETNYHSVMNNLNAHIIRKKGFSYLCVK